MKKIALIVLLLGLTFGATAQQRIEKSFVKSNDTEKTLQSEIKKYQKGIIPVNIQKTSKRIATKSVGATFSDVTTVEDWTNGGFTANYTLTLNDETNGYYLWTVETAAIDTTYPNGDADMIAEVKEIIEYYAYIYSIFGLEFDESDFWLTEAGDMENVGLKANTAYTIIALCVGETDTVIVKKEFTTDTTSLTGTPGMTTMEIDNISSTNAYLNVAKNDNTAYYQILFAETSVFVAYNITTEQDVLDYFAQSTNSSKFTADTTWSLGDDNLLDQNALSPNTEYTVWVVAYNGNGEAVADSIVFTTIESTQNGTAEMTVFNALNITATSAQIQVQKNDQTAFYRLVYATVDELIGWTADSVINYLSTSQYSYTQDTTWTIGATSVASSYALTPNTDYVVWVVPYNGNLVAGTAASLEFSTLESSQNGTAAFTNMEANNITETNAIVDFEINDQTAYYYYFLDPKDTLVAYDQYEQEGALEWMEYLISYYAYYGYSYPNFVADTSIELGSDDNEQYMLAKGTTYCVWGFPYNGNKELGEAKRIEFETDGIVSLKDVVDFTAVSVYPNPASDVVVVNSKNTIKNIEVYNTLGQVVLSQEANTNNISLDITNLTQGNYFVKVTTADNVITTQKVVVR